MSEDKEDKKEGLKSILSVATVGITLAVSIIIGLIIGVYLDRIFGTKPYLTVIFLILGIIAGFRNIYQTVKKYV